MAQLIYGATGRDVYAEVAHEVRSRGVKRSARGLETRDLEDVVIHLDSPLDALPVGCGRNLNRAIAAAEAMQLVGRFSDPEWMVRISPEFAKFREDSGHFHGAYGHRIDYQLADAVAKLKADPDTRQAVIALWDADLDGTLMLHTKKDYPCTVAIGLSRTFNKLNVRVTMRSNDVWLGLPYDLFQFTQLQLSACNALELDPGSYTHTAWSMHLYERNLDDVDKLSVPDSTNELLPTGFGSPGDDIEDIMSRAYMIHNHPGGMTGRLTESERWYDDNVPA